MPTFCSCGANKLYADCCCKPYLFDQQAAPAPAPEALMRSRYSAFTKRKFAYLTKTMTGEAAKAFDITVARRDATLTQWLKLEVLEAEEQGDSGVVEFKAHFRYPNKPVILHEVSQFQKIEGQWLYTSGAQR